MDTRIKDLSFLESVALLVTLTVLAVASLAGSVYVLRFLWGVAVTPTFGVAVPSALTVYLLITMRHLVVYKFRKSDAADETVGDALGPVVKHVVAPWVYYANAHLVIWLLT